MTSLVLRIAALFLLSMPGVCAAASSAGPEFLNVADAEPSDPVDPNLPNAMAAGFFCGGIVRPEHRTSDHFSFKDLEISVDAGNNINVVEKGVLVKQIKSAEYSTFGQCLNATIGAMRDFAK